MLLTKPKTVEARKIANVLPVSTLVQNSFATHYWATLPNGITVVASLINSSTGYEIKYSENLPPESHTDQREWLEKLKPSGLPYPDRRYLYKSLRALAIKSKRRLAAKDENLELSEFSDKLSTLPNEELRC